MRSELQDLIEHLDRYRATTLQVFDLVNESDLEWRPSEVQYSLGQQLLHIAQAEDRLAHGLFDGDWSYDRVRFPEKLPTAKEIKAFFDQVRSYTVGRLKEIESEDLSRLVEVADSPTKQSVRSLLWFVLEHELHHRGQVWAYLREMGYTPPYYAAPLPLGERPDFKAREDLGGF